MTKYFQNQQNLILEMKATNLGDIFGENELCASVKNLPKPLSWIICSRSGVFALASRRMSVVNFLGLVLFFLFMLVVPSLAEESLIVVLRSSGWTEVGKREEIKKLPGETPYANLARVIQMTHFIFEKDGERKACWISYDSQRDQIREGCESLK